MLNFLVRIKSFFQQSKRVFQLTKKPGMVEYKIILKVSSIGILVIGLIGFIIQIVWQASR